MYTISQCLKETPMGDIVSESRELKSARKFYPKRSTEIINLTCTPKFLSSFAYLKLVEKQVMCYSRISLEIDGTLNVAHVFVPIKYILLQSSKSVLCQKMPVLEQLKSQLLVN